MLAAVSQKTGFYNNKCWSMDCGTSVWIVLKITLTLAVQIVSLLHLYTPLVCLWS